MKPLARFAIGLLIGLFTWAAASPEVTGDETNAPVNLTYTISRVNIYVLEGTVSGDLTGQLRSEIVDVRINDPLRDIIMDHTFEADDPAYSFTVRLYGLVVTHTGRIFLNGQITSGWRQGAWVHEEMTLIDPATHSWEGIVRIMPPQQVADD